MTDTVISENNYHIHALKKKNRKIYLKHFWFWASIDV